MCAQFTPGCSACRPTPPTALGTVPGVDWSPIWSAAVAAGIVSAAANGLFAVWRMAAETKARRRDAQRGHLRDAAADFLAAEAAVFRYRRKARDAFDELVAHRQGFPGDQAGIEERSQQRLAALRDRAEGEGEARNAIGRMRLYSQTMHEQAEALLAVQHRSLLNADGADPAPEQREQALQAFVKAARAELGVGL